MPVSAKYELGHSLKPKSGIAGFGNTDFAQIFSSCYRETFQMLPRLVPPDGSSSILMGY